MRKESVLACRSQSPTGRLRASQKLRPSASRGALRYCSPHASRAAPREARRSRTRDACTCLKRGIRFCGRNERIVFLLLCCCALFVCWLNCKLIIIIFVGIIYVVFIKEERLGRSRERERLKDSLAESNLGVMLRVHPRGRRSSRQAPKSSHETSRLCTRAHTNSHI